MITDPFHQAPPVRVRSWRGLVQTVAPTFQFLMETEAHVYAFSIAANVLLSFFPFLLTMVILCRWVFHWEAGVRAILFTVSRFFPDYHNGAYLDIAGSLNAAARAQRKISLLSLLMLFFTSNGIFEPLEVALNRAWRVKKNRSYFRNQLVSLGLIFLCGGVFLISTVVLTLDPAPVTHTLGNRIAAQYGKAFMVKLVTSPVFMMIVFAVYWILPNRKLPATRLIFPSISVGLLLSVMNYLNLVTWPWLLAKLKVEVGPFVHSVSILLWSFFASLVVLAGAEWSARVTLETDNPEGE